MTLAIGFATWRILPLMNSPNNDHVPGQSAMERSIAGLVVPTHDVDTLSVGSDELRGLANESVRKAVLTIEERHRPSAEDAASIANILADYIVLNRSGTLDDAAGWYIQRNRSRPMEISNPDPGKQAQAWAMATAWARFAPLNTEGITARARYFRGQAIDAGAPVGSAAIRRPLRNGGYLWSPPHLYTAYEIRIPASVQNLDAKSVHDVLILITVTNDAPNQGWDIAETTYSGLPEGKIMIPPIP